MLWSLVKILAFVVVVMAATFGATKLLDMDGSATVDIGGTAATFSVIELVIGLIVLVFAVWLLLKLAGLAIATFRFLNGDETAISRYFSRNRERKGFEALSEGMMALASGEGRLAMAKASRAERYLERPELTNLLTAQAAELAGDRRTAEQTYRKLLEDEKTRFVGVRGIMKQKLQDGDTDTALALAEKAFAIKPKHVETQDTLLKLQAEKADWKGARQTLTTKLKTGQLPRNVHTRRDAVLALSEARDLETAGQDAEAREMAIEANRMSPDLVPAAVMATRAFIQQGNNRAATRAVKKAWAAAPHPELAAVFADIVPDETPEKRIKRFAPLVKGHPDNPETKMLRTELFLAAEDYPAARKALGDLVETDPTKRNLTLMAAIERGEGADDAVVKAWLAKALMAPQGPQWICEATGKAYAEWVPYTEGGFDTLSWKRAAGSEGGLFGNAEGMLPLIVGEPANALPDPSKDDVEDAALVEDHSEADTK